MSTPINVRVFVDDGRYDWNEVDSTRGQFRFETIGWEANFDRDPTKPCPYSNAFETLEEAVTEATDWFKNEDEDTLIILLPDGSTRTLPIPKD